MVFFWTILRACTLALEASTVHILLSAGTDCKGVRMGGERTAQRVGCDELILTAGHRAQGSKR